MDCRHGKALFLHVPETLLNVRRYASIWRICGPPPFVSHDPDPGFCIRCRAVAIGVTAVAQLAGQSAPANKTAASLNSLLPLHSRPHVRRAGRK